MAKGLVHEMVQDYLRVAKEIGRSPTRDEYLASGRFSKRQLIHHFGSWLEFIQASGHQPSALARGKKDKDPLELRLQKYDWEKRLFRKFKEELSPYCNKFRNKEMSTRTIVSGSDFHDEYADKFAVQVFLDVCEMEQPDTICLDGDLVDFPEVSSFNKDPTRMNNMQGAIDWVLWLFAELRKRCPKSEIDYVLGNHELRLFKWVCANPGIAGLRAIQFQNLFECEKYGVNIICRQSFLIDKPKRAQNYIIYDNALVAFHGSSCAKHHASTLLGKFGMTGFSGHVHNRQVFSTKDLNGERFWVSLPTMANYELASEYIDDLDHWSNGFGVFHIDKKRVLEVPVVIIDGFAHYAGKFYRRRD